MSTPTIPKYQPPTSAQLANSTMPGYIGLNPPYGGTYGTLGQSGGQTVPGAPVAGGTLGAQAIQADIQGYGLSDLMFNQQNPALAQAQQFLQTGAGISQQGANAMLPGQINNVNQYNSIASSLAGYMPQAMGLMGAGGNQVAYGTNTVNRGAGTVAAGTRAVQGNFAGPQYVGGGGVSGGGGASASLWGGQGQNLQNTWNALSNQASGQTPIDPMVQRQLMQSGLGSAASAFGAQSLGTGSAGQANAAANLGLNVQNYINSQRQMALSGLGSMQGLGQSVIGAGQAQVAAGGAQIGAGTSEFGLGTGMVNNATSALQGANTMASNFQNQNLNIQNLGSQLFPRRQYGLSGASVAQLGAQNVVNQNNYNQALYASQVQQQQFIANQGAQQAGLQASNTSSMLGTGASVAAAAAVAAFCGIAMRVLGTKSRKWERFRHWLNYQADPELRKFYRANVATIRESLTGLQIEILRPILSTFADKVDYVPANA